MASEQFSLCWDNFHKNMSSGLNALLETEELVDVTLAVEGKYLKAHKMVLSVCSPYFKELFKANPCQHPIVFMKDVSYVAISDLLQFMYQGEVQVSQDNLTTFIKTAEALQIKGLTNGSADAESDSTHDVKSTTSSSRQHVDTDYKPRPKKQPAPSPISVPAPISSKAQKRPRLSVSSNDSQSNPPVSSITAKTEPISAIPETNTSSTGGSMQQFKVEPYDQNQSVTIPDDGDDNFGDDTLDDTTVDDTEDYSMMEGEETEPQAGTSADGTGEGQAFKRAVMEELYLINSKLDCLTEIVTLKSYSHFMKPSFDVSSSEKFFEKIPIKCVEELVMVEQWLENKENYRTMVEELNRIGGTNLAHSVRNILYRTLTNELAENYSWDGAKQKRPFKHLLVAKGILDAVKIQYKEATETEIINVIKLWLVKAKERTKYRKESIHHDIG